MQYIMEMGENAGEGIKIKISVDNGRLISFSPEYIISQILGYLKTEISTSVVNPARVVVNVCFFSFVSFTECRSPRSGHKNKWMLCSLPSKLPT